MWATIVLALEALPKIANLGVDLVRLFSQFLEQMRQERIDGWINEGRKIERELTNATSDEERKRILRELQRLRGSLPNSTKPK